MIKTFNLADGKYTIISDIENATIKCLRWGKEWRDLTGDELFFYLIDEVIKAKNSIFECPDCGYNVTYQEFVSQFSFYGGGYG